MLTASEKTIRLDLVDEALNNLQQGVLMFDKDDNLIICNDRYIEMYGLDPTLNSHGCTFAGLIAMHMELPPTSSKVLEYCARIHRKAKNGQITSFCKTIADGRSIHIINRPLASGSVLVTHDDVSELINAQARIEHMAHHDALTDLPNRLLFRAQLDEALRWSAPDYAVAVLFIDLDNFKSINDTLGHAIGDGLLKLVADRLRSSVRETDTIARLGGDEFVVVCTRIECETEAADMATRIREVIAKPFEISEHSLVVDASIGIAISSDGSIDAEQLVKNADMALYGAKNGGRGTFRFFEAEMDSRMMARRSMDIDLRSALLKGEFELHFQPLVNLESRQISSFEALVRWHHPTRGLILPDVFIPVAEETGLIVRLGEWVMRTACCQAARWPDNVTVAVNVSPVQFQKQNLLELVISALAASGLSAERLEIEVTESVLMQQTEATLKTLESLHAIGVKIAMDDFGTGYSSLSYLQKFPFDKIKIDQSFIHGLSDRDESTAIIRAVTGLAGTFRMTTTAEGVETEEQRRMVAALGCTEMQGHLFSKALTAAETDELMRNCSTAVTRVA